MTRGTRITAGFAIIAAAAAMWMPPSLHAQAVPLGVNASFSTADYAVTPFYGRSYGLRGCRPYFGGGYHASTFTEGYLRGAAALTVAQGQAAFYRSEAWKNQEIARNMFLQNRMFVQEQIRQLRMIREAEQEKEKAEILARNLERRRRRAANENEAEVKPEAEVTEWPRALRDGDFLAHRKQIRGLLELRAELPNDQVGPVNRAIQLSLRDLYEDLKADTSTDAWSDDQKQDVKSYLNTTYASTVDSSKRTRAIDGDDSRLVRND